MCIQQGMKLCLCRSYTCASKSSPVLFTPFHKQHVSKTQMTSQYYKTGIDKHLTHFFSSHKKSASVAGGNTSNSKGNV